MTQKELLYYEDAIMHEANTIKICNDIKKRLDNKDLVSFVEDEIKKHTSIKEVLMNKLEEKTNE